MAVLHDQSISHDDLAPGSARDLCFVGDDGNRPSLAMQHIEQVHDFLRRLGVKIPCRLIGEDKPWRIHQRTCEGDALRLST